MTSTVSLVPASKPNLSQTDRLEIVAADLADALGRPIDGNDDCQPGGNFVATFTKQGIAFAQPSVRLDRADGEPVRSVRRASHTEIIDALLERTGLDGLGRPARRGRRDVAASRRAGIAT
jgi:hypothetical protein